MRLAFIGFRHAHIEALYELARKHADVEIVAACEDHAPTRDALAKAGRITLTHDDYRELLAEVDCDAVAVGDYYARRGEILLAALEAGRHVIADKPLCTRLDELDRIAELSRTRKLCVGCQLDMRDRGTSLTARKLLQHGAIGEVQTVTFLGQHPLMYGSRPGWYFEPGQHGGTINDIAIHAVDMIRWATGRRIVEVVAARAWNTGRVPCDFFQDGAQLMLRLDNDGGVLGDVSYLMPDACGYSLPLYWRVTLHGSDGVLEILPVEDTVLLAGKGEKGFGKVTLEPGIPDGVLDSFVREARGETEGLSPSTAEVLESSRVALLAQHAADHDLRSVAV